MANSGHVMGIISEVALSFMVQDPREIIEVFRDRSRACSLYRYLHQHSHKSTATQCNHKSTATQCSHATSTQRNPSLKN